MVKGRILELLYKEKATEEVYRSLMVDFYKKQKGLFSETAV